MQDRQRPERRRTSVRPSRPFRYTAVVLGTGEIPEIVESIGRRQVRTIEPSSREGRRLLRRGRVRLWRDPLTRGELAPVADVLERLRDSVQREHRGHPADDRFQDCCRRRLETIDHWEALYRDDGLDH